MKPVRNMKPDTMTNPSEPYDSKFDTLRHKKYLYDVILLIAIQNLFERAESHDESKLKDPEKSFYDKYVPMLKPLKYGTPEADAVTKKMNKGLEHHFKENRHHPEHFKDGIAGMNLIDLVEMVCDWFAASLRSDTPFNAGGLDKNIEKFNIPPMLESIIRNTYNDYLKDFETYVKTKGSNESYMKDLKLQLYENNEKGLFNRDLLDYFFTELYTIAHRKDTEEWHA